MLVRVDVDRYDTDSLNSLGSGTYGEVYDLGNRRAVKIYYDRPDEFQKRKLLQMCDSGAALMANPDVRYCVAFPQSTALDTSDEVVGYSMWSYAEWPRLSSLAYDLQNKRYRSVGSYYLTDATAVKAIFQLFLVLNGLEKRHIVLGDISGANLLYNVKEEQPGFIDLDSAHFENWESDSPGTEGYIDPNLLEADCNSQGGLNFDAKSDVFAVTVLAHYLILGAMPFTFGSQPEGSPEENAIRRLSSFRIAVEGDSCLREHGMRLLSPELTNSLGDRIAALRSIKGESGRDGEILYDHFVSVFVNDERENLVGRLPDNDLRNPAFSIIRMLRGAEAVTELEARFPKPRRVDDRDSIRQPIRAGTVQRQKNDFAEKDPSGFGPFLALRGIDYAGMVGA